MMPPAPRIEARTISDVDAIISSTYKLGLERLFGRTEGDTLLPMRKPRRGWFR